MTARTLVPLARVSALLLIGSAQAQDGGGSADLAKQLANPVSSLISVPFQGNYDDNFGPHEGGHRYTLNVQPVIPISLNQDWNLISRTILPIINQHDIAPGAGSQTGLGDTVQSIFFSPKKPSAGGWIWGAGPVFLLPTATDDLLGSKKWGAGPTAVALRQVGPWTYGMLGNHIWSFAGSSSRNDISATFLQPFVSYTTPDAVSFSVNAESTYDWKAEEWNVPVNFVVAKVTKFGNQLVQLQGGVRYYVADTRSGPKDWGFRLGFVLLFPK